MYLRGRYPWRRWNVLDPSESLVQLGILTRSVLYSSQQPGASQCRRLRRAHTHTRADMASSHFSAAAAAAVVSVSMLAQTAYAGLYPGLSTANHTCALADPVLSCSKGAADPAKVDTCCVETYGGLLLQTQFWNTYTGLEAEGQLLPPNSWTIHGLWPGTCPTLLNWWWWW